jgi:WxL Interacting Protein, peptidoglycan binding domain
MRRAVALAATVLAVALAAVPPAGAATQPVGSVSVTPGSGASLAPGGGYFLLHGAPDASFEQSVTVANNGSAPVTAVMAGVDATTAAGTGAVYGAPGEVPTRVGTWIVPDESRFELASHETKTLRFSVHVPPGVVSGQYLGGLSVGIGVPSAPSPAPTSPTTSGFGVAITMQTQRVLAVEVDIPGVPFVPNLVVRGTRFATAGIGRVLAVTVANDGNGFAHGSGTIAAPAQHVNLPIAVGTFVPGTSAEYQVPWPPGADEQNQTIEVSIDYDGRALRWSGVAGGAPTTPPTQPAAHHSGGMRVGVVVLVVGGIALVVGLVFVGFGRRRRIEPRRRSRPVPSRTSRRPARPVQRSRGRG